MARYKCPCCGTAYNGKKCRNCFYERFTEEVTHGNHTHEGEPLVVRAPVRQPVKRKDPFGCDTRTKKKPRRRGLILLLVLIFLSPILSGLFAVVSYVGELISDVAGKPEPEPGFLQEQTIALPADGYVLYDDSDILVVADWQDGQEFGEGFSFFVQNNSDQDVVVSSPDLAINGYLMEYTTLFCSAEEGATEERSFRLNETDAANVGIGAVQEITFSLEIYDMDDYETVASTDTITMTASVPEDAVLSDVAEGTTVFEQDGIQVRYLGYCPDPYYSEEFYEGTLLFHIDNTTDRDLNVYIPEFYVNDEALDISMWCQLPAGTRAVTSVYLFRLEDTDFRSVEDLGTMEFQLEIEDQNDYDWSITSDTISVSAAQ